MFYSLALIFIYNFKFNEVLGARFGRFKTADNSSSIVYILGNTMIDTRPPNQKTAILNYLKNKDIEKVVLTHHHEDHSGNGYDISHEKEVKFLENGFSLKAYQLIFFGKSKKFVSRPFDKIIETGIGLRLEPVHTPGHSEDHVCFFEPQKKWLFTGDMFLSVKPRLFRADENLEKQILSLKKILEYDFEVVFLFSNKLLV